MNPMTVQAGNANGTPTIICRYCRYAFAPEPVVFRRGKKRRTYIECPRCGNGIEREYRPYDNRKRAYR